MRLIESDGKRVLHSIGITIPEQDSFPGFVKAQVLTGGRGKAGFVRRVETAQQLPEAIAHITQALGTLPCAGFLVEKEVPYVKSWFLSIDLDRKIGDWRVNLSEQGGMDVAHATSRPLSGFSHPSKELTSLVLLLGDAMRLMDIESVEINPLAQKADGSFVALDAKVVLDDQAGTKHPEWASFVRLPSLNRPYSDRENEYRLLVQGNHQGTFGQYLELDGNIALILSGGGASLVALDALQNVGGKPANYVELSGNPNPELAKRAASIVFSKKNISAIWIAGSYANFTDIASTLAAFRAAYDEANLTIPFVVRRDGPRADEAEQETIAWATKKGIRFAFHRADTTLDASAKRVMELVNA